MQHKTIIKLVSALILTSVAVIALARVRSAQPREQLEAQPQPLSSTSASSTLAQNSIPGASSSEGQSLTKNSMPPEMREKTNAANGRADEAEKQARQLLKERRFEEAEKACYHALTLSPKINGQPSSMTAMQLLGDVYREQGRYKYAIDTYSKAREHMRDLQLDLGIALSYLKLGDMENARKFYSEQKVFSRDLPKAKQAAYFAQLPGTKTAKTMEASIYFARGCEKSSFADRAEAVLDYQKALRLVPHNALIASKCAWDLGNLYRGQEATPYWARAAVFGTGETAREGRRRLNNSLMPDKVEQALRDAKKIR